MARKMTQEQCKAELRKLLGDSMSCAEGLKDILAVERDALELRDADALNNAATQKQIFINNLEELEASRSKISTVCGFGRGPEYMPALAEWCNDESSTANSWQNFIAVVKDCSELNSTNGTIINVMRQQTKIALSLLRSGDPDSDIYGPHGQTAGTLGTHSLAEV